MTKSADEYRRQRDESDVYGQRQRERAETAEAECDRLGTELTSWKIEFGGWDALVAGKALQDAQAEARMALQDYDKAEAKREALLRAHKEAVETLELCDSALVQRLNGYCPTCLRLNGEHGLGCQVGDVLDRAREQGVIE